MTNYLLHGVVRIHKIIRRLESRIPFGCPKLSAIMHKFHLFGPKKPDFQAFLPRLVTIVLSNSINYTHSPYCQYSSNDAEQEDAYISNRFTV